MYVVLHIHVYIYICIYRAYTYIQLFFTTTGNAGLEGFPGQVLIPTTRGSHYAMEPWQWEAGLSTHFAGAMQNPETVMGSGSQYPDSDSNPALPLPREERGAPADGFGHELQLIEEGSLSSFLGFPYM